MKHEEVLEALKHRPKNIPVTLEFTLAGHDVTAPFKDESLKADGLWGLFKLANRIAAAFYHRGVTVDHQSEFGNHSIFWRASATPEVWQEVLTLHQPGVIPVVQEAINSLMAAIDPGPVIPKPRNPFEESDHVYIAFAKPALALA